MPRIEITELFLAKADWNRTYVGTITRDKFDDGSMIVHGTIPVEKNIIIATANNDKELGKKLDELVVLILDHDIMELKPKILFNPHLLGEYGSNEIAMFNVN